MASNDTDAAIRTAWQGLGGFLEAAQQGTFLDELAVKLNDALAQEVPEFARGSVIRPDLDASTHGLVSAFFRTMADDPYGHIEIPPGPMVLARTMALHNRDVGPLLRAYRIGQRIAWSELVDMMTGQIPDPEQRLVVVSFLHDRLSTELERIVESSVAVFTEERDRRLSGALARKADVIQTLLRGEPVDWDDATRSLGHRLRRHQLALQLWLDDGAAEADSLRRLEAAANGAAQRLNGPPPLTLANGSRSLSAWLNVAGDTDLSALDEVASAAPGVRLAVGTPAYGAAGFRTSHQQALRARTVAETTDAPQPVTRYADVEVVSTFLADPEAMHELIRRELGGLGVRGDAAARLRETALAYLRAGGSARDAAEVLEVHKNTVIYRLRGIEEALGHPIDARRLTLEIALQIVEQLGEGSLPDDAS